MIRFALISAAVAMAGVIDGMAQFYDSTTNIEAAAFVDQVQKSVGNEQFGRVSRLYALDLAKTLGVLDRNMITPSAFVEHIEQAEQVRDRFYPNLDLVNFRTYLLPFRIRSENASEKGWRKSLREKLEPQIKGLTAPDAVATKILSWCKSTVKVQDADCCYPLSLKGDLDPLTTVKLGVGSEVDISILAVAALRSVGIVARIVYTPAIAGETGGKVWVEYRADDQWAAWVATAPDGVDGKKYLMERFKGQLALILANPEEPINVTSSYVPIAHIDVTFLNVEMQDRPGWNLMLMGKDQLYPVTGRDIYIRLNESVQIGAGEYVIVAGDRSHASMLKPISIKAGDNGSYTLDISKKGSQIFDVASAISATSITSQDDVQPMNAAAVLNPALW